jgi:histidyl-tRNA synthetase
MLELTPGQQRQFNCMQQQIAGVYEQYGYAPIATPAMEWQEVLLAKGGGETAMQIYKIAGEELALRFDLTVPATRYAAQYQDRLAFPFRRYQMQPVWRGEKSQLGRFCEFWQCDIDVFGAASVLYDAEMPVVINAVFEELGLGDFTIWLNNRKILNGVLETIGCSGRETEVLRIVDKLERGDEAVLIGALENLDLSRTAIDELLAFVKMDGSDDELLAFLSGARYDSAVYRDGVDELITVMSAVRSAGVPERRCRINLGIARGLDYYTGTVYETTLNKYPTIGSVCSGGRFDNLANNYTERSLPGVGVSIGLSRLFWQLDRINALPVLSDTPATVMVAPLSPEVLNYALDVARQIRATWRSVLTQMDASMKPKAQFKYADALGVPYVIVIGGDEMAGGTVTLRCMRESHQEAQISLNEAIALMG